MSSDINVQTFSGKVNITSNLLVGTSHLFVDTINNRVGLVTNTPDAGLHVNSNAYVHTDFRVGSGIVMNDTAGQITAGSFVGDGSAMTGINSDSGSWVNGTDVVYLSTTTDKVGIGTTDPEAQLHIGPKDNDHIYLASANNNYGWKIDTDDQGSGAVPFRIIKRTDDVDTTVLTIKNQDGNVGIGTTGPTEALQIYRNGTDPTYIWAIGNTSNRAGIAFSEDTSSKHAIIEYDGTGSDTGNYLAIYSGVSNWTTKGNGLNFVPANGRVGIGTSSPDGKLHIYESTGTSHGVGVGTLILDRGNSGGSSSIVFPSRVNITSDYGYITYNENYGEAGVSSSENGVLLLGAENDGTGSSDHVRVKTRLVVEADMTSSDPTYAFQVKSSNTTSDLFAVHRGGSIGINGNTLTVPFTIQTNKTIAVNGTSYNSYCRWYRGSGGWYIGSDNSTDWNQNLYWFSYINATGNPLRKVIMFENDQSKGTNLNANTFTGQHRNRVKGVNPTNIGTRVGLIVSADNNENIKVNGGVERGLDAITINETIPYVSVTTKAYDKKVFGVISGSEDPESREDKFGRVTSTFTKEEGDDRIFINSLGEGAMWISNQNGSLESGDYVTSSDIPGYGMKQESEFLANYTVAKITMNCDFQATPRVKYRIKTERKTVNYYRHEESFLKESDYNKLETDTQSDYTLEQYDENVNILDEHGQLQWEDSGETEAPYKVRYLLPDGTQISEEEYTTRALADERVFIAAFVGCTYHCG
jgi:hypothetical protein